jgi:hypothetical protein
MSCQCSLRGKTNQIVSWKNAALFARRFWRSADVHMAQIVQHRFIFVAHAAREVRIIQVLIPSRLGHVPQDGKPMLNGILTVLWHLLPLRNHFVSDMTLLYRRQLRPILGRLFLLLFLSRSELLKVPVGLQDSLLLLLRQTVEFLCWRWRVRRRRPVRIAIRPRIRVRPVRIRRRRAVRSLVLALLHLSPTRLLLLLSMFLFLLLPRRRFRWLRRLIRRTILSPIRPPALCVARHQDHGADPQRHQTSRELEPQSHLSYIFCVWFASLSSSFCTGCGSSLSGAKSEITS